MSLLKVNEVQNYNGSSLTLTASTVSTSAQLNTGGNISVTGSINVSDDSTTRSNLGLGSIATQAADSVDIDGGTIDGTTIGGTSAATGTFTTFTSTGIDDNASSTALTIDSSGNLLVGKPSADNTTAGTTIYNTDGFSSVRDNNTVAILNRLTSDGDIMEFRKDGTTVGSIGVRSSSDPFFVDATGTGLKMEGGISSIVPCNTVGQARDNAIDLGQASGRFDDIYATNATIQTSDANEKQDIEELSEAEQRVATAAKGFLRKYRWKSAVAKKGDDARMHFGIIAQDLKGAFEAEGLDAGRYGMFIHSEWWETEETYTDDNGAEKTRINTFDTEEEAPEGAVKKDRMGIRYSELLAFIIAAI